MRGPTRVALLALLVVVERRTASPLVDLTALAHPPIAMTNIASVFFGFALFASFVGTANYVQAAESTGYGFGSSVLVAGLCLLPSGLAMLLLAPVAARLCASIGAGRVLALSGVIVAAGLLIRIFLVDDLWQVVVGASVVGAGTGDGHHGARTLVGQPLQVVRDERVDARTLQPDRVQHAAGRLGHPRRRAARAGARHDRLGDDRAEVGGLATAVQGHGRAKACSAPWSRRSLALPSRRLCRG